MFIVDILGNLMRIFYNLFHNYGLAILLFTLFSKIILLPISVWVQKFYKNGKNATQYKSN